MARPEVFVVSQWAFVVFLTVFLSELVFVILCVLYVPPSDFSGLSLTERVKLQVDFISKHITSKSAIDVLKSSLLTKNSLGFLVPLFFYFVSFSLFPLIVASTIELSVPPHTYFLLTFTLWRAGFLFLLSDFDHILALEKYFDSRLIYLSSAVIAVLFMVECYVKKLCNVELLKKKAE